MNRSNSSNLFSRIYLFSIVVFLYLPILVMILMSFNTSKFYQLPIDWTFDWYVELAGNKKLLKAGWNSLFVAIVSTIISSVLGTCVAYAFFRFDFKGKRFLQILLLPPITIPWLIIGTSMLIFFFLGGNWERTFSNDSWACCAFDSLCCDRGWSENENIRYCSGGICQISWGFTSSSFFLK